MLCNIHRNILLFLKSLLNTNNFLGLRHKKSLHNAGFILNVFKKFNYKVPLLACSLSIDSNKALKLPAPNPFAPIL